MYFLSFLIAIAIALAPCVISQASAAQNRTATALDVQGHMGLAHRQRMSQLAKPDHANHHHQGTHRSVANDRAIDDRETHNTHAQADSSDCGHDKQDCGTNCSAWKNQRTTIELTRPEGKCHWNLANAKRTSSARAALIHQHQIQVVMLNARWFLNVDARGNRSVLSMNSRLRL